MLYEKVRDAGGVMARAAGLKSCRVAAGLEQAEVAERAGVKPRTYGAWERGERVPNADNILAVCEAIGCEPNDALGWWETHERPVEDLTADEQALVGDYRACDEDGRRAVAEVARISARSGR